MIKTDFLRKHQIGLSEKFTVTKQTFLVTTLRATAGLTDDLLIEGFEYVLLVRFRSDPDRASLFYFFHFQHFCERWWKICDFSENLFYEYFLEKKTC